MYRSRQQTSQPIVTPPSDTPQTLAWQLLGELETIRAERFDWVHDIRERLVEDLKRSRDHYRKWRRKADTLISIVKAENSDQADWLAGKLLEHPSVHDPGHFEIIIPTGVGHEVFKIVGFEGSKAAEPTVALDSDVAHEPQEDLRHPEPLPPTQEASRLLSLIDPTDIAPIMTLAPLTLLRAMRQRLWISWTPSGSAFCLTCPCAEFTIPRMSLDPSDTTYDFIPRYFHEDPFVNDRGIQHFRAVHGLHFSGGLEEMVTKYGREVIPSQDEKETSLDKWAVAGHNYAVQVWYGSLLSKWEDLRKQYSRERTDRRPVLRRTRPGDTMTIKASSLNQHSHFAFGWPEPFDSKWVVLCSYPKCTQPALTKHPLQQQDTFKHFKSHGIFLRDKIEMVKLFGIKILQDTTIRRENSEEEGEDNHEEDDAQGLQDFQDWPRSRLRRECQRRGLSSNARKASLKRKLEKHDTIIAKKQKHHRKTNR
ncbi:hypothetical protein F5Y12DRAFT_38799 [Xylaria sp. FL1777]|nr:hypothetical protein F5Y12DRAFT_38799 [Xylaria sp. FL1777]